MQPVAGATNARSTPGGPGAARGARAATDADAAGKPGATGRAAAPGNAGTAGNAGAAGNAGPPGNAGTAGGPPAPPEPPAVGPSPTAAFARRARERMARGEPLVVAIGGNEVVLPPALREPVLALLDRGAAGGADRAGAGLPPLPLDLPPEVTSGQAADLLGVPRAVLDQLVARGELPATRRGPRLRIATADVVALRDRVRSGRTASLADVVAVSRDLGLYPDDDRGDAGPPGGGGR